MTKHDAERKVKILDFIAATLRARGYPPSVREIARAVGLASTSAVHHHLQILEREGYLERGAAAVAGDPPDARPPRIRLGLTSELVPAVGARRTPASLPIIGEIAAGGPIEAYQDASETMAVPDMLAPGGDAYVLQGPRRLDDRGPHRRRRLRPHPARRRRPATATSSSPRSRRTRSP